MPKSTGEGGAATVKVWDPFVRIFHWGLVAGFTVAYVTEDDLLTPHIWAGYLVGALIALRLPWGLIGPRHARFSDFVYRPRNVAAYLGDMLGFRARRCLGHSPAGGAMIVALLVVVAATVITGIAANNGSYLTGRIAGVSDSVTPAGAMASARLYSLVECVKANKLEPYAYLRHVFTELPKAQSLQDIEALLPYNVDPAVLSSANHFDRSV